MVAPGDEGGETISSSRIREALQAGDCATAARLLTRPFTVRGTVQHGDKNGRLLGFPTANLDMGAYLRPRYGIYAVTGHLPDRSEGHTSELQSLMRNSYAVFCLQKKNTNYT